MGLMDALAGWLKQIIAVLLLAAMVDLLLPNRTMQRYVRLVAGLFILLTIAGPLLQWLRGDFTDKLEERLNAMERVPDGTADELSRIEAEGLKWRTKVNEEATGLVVNRLQDAIRADVEQSEKHAVKEVRVTAGLTANGLLDVTDVTVVLEAPVASAAASTSAARNKNEEMEASNHSETEGVVPVGEVAPVQVQIPPGVGDRSETGPASTVSPDPSIQLRISGFIAARYGIPPDHVQVEQSGISENGTGG